MTKHLMLTLNFPKAQKSCTCSAGYYSLVVLVNSIGMISSLLFWQGVASKDDLFLFGREGCSHFGPDLYATLRVSSANT